jgi:hypothetical protein
MLAGPVASLLVVAPVRDVTFFYTQASFCPTHRFRRCSFQTGYSVAEVSHLVRCDESA